MKAEQVDQALRQKFVTDDQRLVFWHDTERRVRRLHRRRPRRTTSPTCRCSMWPQVGGLSAKLRLEREDPTGKYLVYSQGEVPPAEEDWLLDIRLYSAQFHADVASIWLQELGLSSLSLRDHLKARATFLGSQERRKKLARLVSARRRRGGARSQDDGRAGGQPGGHPLRRAARALSRPPAGWPLRPDTEPPEVIATFEKMDLLDRFWALMQQRVWLHRRHAQRGRAPAQALCLGASSTRRTAPAWHPLAHHRAARRPGDATPSSS